MAVFKPDGSRVEVDPRFQVNPYNATAIEIVAPMGLRGIDDMIIE